jgi:hypothetical protein
MQTNGRRSSRECTNEEHITWRSTLTTTCSSQLPPASMLRGRRWPSVRTPNFAPDGRGSPAETRVGTAVSAFLLARRCLPPGQSPKRTVFSGSSARLLWRVPREHMACLSPSRASCRNAGSHSDEPGIATRMRARIGHRSPHSRTRPDLVGHTTRPLTFIRTGQRPCCASCAFA